MDMRELKGLEIAARCRITFEAGAWVVPSQSGQGKYRVGIGSASSCQCEDFQLNGGKPCKHVHAARLVCERDHGGKAPEIDVATLPKKVSGKQNWPLYNAAQMSEKHRFQELLFDLCRGVEEPPHNGRGRKRTPMADMVFSTCLKVFTGLSSRRFACDLSDAHDAGYLSHLMHSVNVCAFLESDLMTPVLKQLIVRSALPLHAVEKTFAPDSTGFSTSRFEKWYDEKYGQYRSSRAWVKLHAMVGTTTNVITAVEILDRDAADCPQFKPLTETTAENFKIDRMCADKAYLSNDNLGQIHALGGTLYVPFKSNSTAGEPGSIWERMFHFYQFRREEFLRHYHQRSNVESTFSMLKAKFRDSVRSKTDTAMRNEVLCKVLCHNIVVVHQSHVELGIEPVFWQDEPKAEAPAVLAFKRPV